MKAESFLIYLREFPTDLITRVVEVPATKQGNPACSVSLLERAARVVALDGRGLYLKVYKDTTGANAETLTDLLMTSNDRILSKRFNGGR